MVRVGPVRRAVVRNTLERKLALAGLGADNDPVVAVLVDVHAQDRGVERGEFPGIGAVEHRLLQESDHASILASVDSQNMIDTGILSNPDSARTGVGPSIDRVLRQIRVFERLHVIDYPAMLDVPRELVQYLGRLLAAERQRRGTRTGTRALTCFYQALMVLVWFRKGEDVTLLGVGFGLSRATAYRYRDEGIAVLAAQAQDLHTALRRVASDGWSHVILDGKLFDCDRLTETTISVKGETIDAWYSGKHRDFGANIQAVMRPDGLPVWTSAALPGHLHDLTCAQQLGVTA